MFAEMNKRHADVQYLKIAKRILEYGTYKQDRTGTGTLSVFAPQIRFDLQKGFPLLTTKKVFVEGIIHELLWFLKGDTNIKYLVDRGVNIWNDDAYRMYVRYYKENHQNREPMTSNEFVHFLKTNDSFAETYGELGRVYGAQWRSWQGYDGEITDQIQWVIDEIKRNPDSRRLIVSAWNVGELDKMALPPCHLLFQFYVSDGKLSCQMYQRSADWFLGIPFNIASYALLTHMIAHVTGLEVGELVMTFGDAHIYSNHIEQIQLQISRFPRDLPVLYLNQNVGDIFNFSFQDIVIDGYNPHPAIKGKVSVGI